MELIFPFVLRFYAACNIIFRVTEVPTWIAVHLVSEVGWEEFLVYDRLQYGLGLLLGTSLFLKISSSQLASLGEMEVFFYEQVPSLLL